MSDDTIARNEAMTGFSQCDSVWLFGYGSLIFKVDFPFIERRPAHIAGWSRRFWQGSHDHRGTVQAPGRVATLIEDEGATCTGMAYLIAPEVFDHLDRREQNGYLRLPADILFEDGGGAAGLFYLAPAENVAFLGPASEREIARQIAGAKGASGCNADYLFALAAALRRLGGDDRHVFEIERHLQLLDASQR